MSQEIFGYKLSKLKLLLTVAVSFLTGIIFAPLVFYWRRDWLLKFTHTLCDIKEATYVLLEVYSCPGYLCPFNQLLIQHLCTRTVYLCKHCIYVYLSQALLLFETLSLKSKSTLLLLQSSVQCVLCMPSWAPSCSHLRH